MSSCSMPGCSNNRRFKPEDISFYTFPRGELLKSWLKACGKDINTWTWSKNKVVCSRHFRPEDIVQRGKKKYLKTDAVPINMNTCEKNVSLNSTTLSSVNVPSSSTESAGRTSLKRKLSYKKSATSVSTKTGTQQDTLSSTTSTENSVLQSDSSGTKRRKIEFVKNIHSYSISPRKLKKQNVQISKKRRVYRRKLYEANRKISSLQKEVSNLKTVVIDLEKQNILSTDALKHLEKSYESVPSLIMSRFLKNVKNNTVTHENYPPELREFASTLQFYSSKGYEYVRKEFALALPHQSTIRKWCSNVDCLPGFITPAFDALKTKVNESAANGREVICSLLIDEVGIKKQIEFDGKRLWGYVDIGIPSETELKPATEVFVVMVVSHQSHWKIPIAYFIIKSLNGQEKANIVFDSLTRLHEIGIVVTSLTCDGPSVNLAMIEELHCKVDDIHNIVPWFTHPSDEKLKVFCMLDACHMLKLVRNLLAAYEQIRDPQGNLISWNYITALHKLQDNESLNIANKLKKSHMEWHRQKMKVNLAAQTFSRSVADALEFLCTELKLPTFSGCEATINFIRKIDFLFDILNSRSPWAKEFKAPIKVDNKSIWRSFLLDTVQYLIYCTDVKGTPLWNTPRKTPIIGFVICAISVCGIFDEFVKCGRLNYLLTYKCSQDQLEIFFCSIRSRNGWNNNPTALQFMRTFKKVLLHSSISGRGGNCKVLDTTTVLTVSSTESSTQSYNQTYDVSLYRKYNIDIFETQLLDHEYDIVPNFIPLNEVTSNVVTYMSGFVLKMLYKRNKCMLCFQGCGTKMDDIYDIPNYKLLISKNRGGVYIPSQGVVSVCLRVETLIRRIINHTEYKLPQEQDFFNYFVTAVAQIFYRNINDLFPNISDHFFKDSLIEQNHGFVIIKDIIYCYTRIRFFNLAKRYTNVIQGKLVRRQLNKLILFNHQ